MKILLIEKNVDLLNICLPDIQAQWSKYEIISVSESKEALDVVSSEFVDIVITEIELPLINGVDLLSILNTEYKSKFGKIYIGANSFKQTYEFINKNIKIGKE